MFSPQYHESDPLITEFVFGPSAALMKHRLVTRSVVAFIVFAHLVLLPPGASRVQGYLSSNEVPPVIQFIRFLVFHSCLSVVFLDLIQS